MLCKRAPLKHWLHLRLLLRAIMSTRAELQTRRRQQHRLAAWRLWTLRQLRTMMQLQ
jgi:hypothetical protein